MIGDLWKVPRTLYGYGAHIADEGNILLEVDSGYIHAKIRNFYVDVLDEHMDKFNRETVCIVYWNLTKRERVALGTGQAKDMTKLMTHHDW